MKNDSPPTVSKKIEEERNEEINNDKQLLFGSFPDFISFTGSSQEDMDRLFLSRMV